VNLVNVRDFDALIELNLKDKSVTDAYLMVIACRMNAKNIGALQIIEDK